MSVDVIVDGGQCMMDDPHMTTDANGSGELNRNKFALIFLCYLPISEAVESTVLDFIPFKTRHHLFSVVYCSRIAIIFALISVTSRSI